MLRLKFATQYLLIAISTHISKQVHCYIFMQSHNPYEFMIKNNIQSLFKDSISLKNQCIEQGFDSLIAMGDDTVLDYEWRAKLLLCGNGGSRRRCTTYWLLNYW